MAEDEVWEQALATCAREGWQTTPFDAPGAEHDVRKLTASAPPAVQAFCEQWWRTPGGLWRAVLAGAQSVQNASSASEDITALDGEPVPQLLRSLLAQPGHVAHVALAARAASISSKAEAPTPDHWSYLVQVRSTPAGSGPRHFRLHPPASPSGIAAAEAVLAMPLPPSYRHLLFFTNGFGLDAAEWTDILGAGPERADWTIVASNDWLRCGPFHEITARWREFQGVYAEERTNDPDSFQSDERPLVPFQTTYGGDCWCFDRSRRRDDGECAIVYWDHELREASDSYDDFARWLRDEALAAGT